MVKELFHFLIGDLIWLYILAPLFFILSGYLTYKTGFVQLRFLKETWSSLFEKTKNSVGITPLQAFSLSMAGRIGAGNIIGVTFAISLGGPGAIFWMWVVAFLSMALAFIENILAQVYKVKRGDLYHGGPAYYIAKGLKSPKLGALFAIVFVFVFGLLFNVIQSSTILDMVSMTYSVESNYSVLFVLLVITAVAITGGLRRVSHITEIIVPLALLIYLLLILGILIMHISALPAVLKLIISNAFGGKEMMVGAIASAMVQGVKRGLLFNGTGMGSATLAGSTANTRHPAKQGLLQSLGVFVDTVFISGSTAFIILMSGVYGHGIPNGILLVQASITHYLGGFAPYYVSTILLLTSFTAIVGNYYYGETNITYLSERKGVLITYRFAVLGMLILGAFVNIDELWNIVTFFVGSMTIINLVVIFLLSGTAFKVWDNYLQQKKIGKVPYFYAEDIPGLEGADCWEKPDSLKEKTREDAYFKAMPR